jgi:hypothetical protein
MPTLIARVLPHLPLTHSIQIQVSFAGHAKLGGSGAGWVIDGDNALPLVTLPQNQTSEVLLCPITGLQVGDVVTAVGISGQIDSGGNAVTLALDARKVTGASGGHSDASLGTASLASVTTDTEVTPSTLVVSELTETIAANEQLYITLTGTTGATTDVELYNIVVTVTRNR